MFINPLRQVLCILQYDITFAFVVAITLCKVQRKVDSLKYWVSSYSSPKNRVAGASKVINELRTIEFGHFFIQTELFQHRVLRSLDPQRHQSSVPISSAFSSQHRDPRLILVCKSKILNHIRHPPAISTVGSVPRDHRLTPACIGRQCVVLYWVSSYCFLRIRLAAALL
jgi:hypothetical protein